MDRRQKTVPGHAVIKTPKPGETAIDKLARVGRCRFLSITTVMACILAAHCYSPIATSADTQTPKRIRVDGKTQRTKLIHEVPAKYPQDAKDHHIEGVVHLKVTIGTDGTAKELEAVSGHPLLVKAALEAVRQWRYEPTEVKGEPVEVVTGVAVVFKLP
jgi:TonB family protein